MAFSLCIAHQLFLYLLYLFMHFLIYSFIRSSGFIFFYISTGSFVTNRRMQRCYRMNYSALHQISLSWYVIHIVLLIYSPSPPLQHYLCSIWNLFFSSAKYVCPWLFILYIVVILLCSEIYLIYYYIPSVFKSCSCHLRILQQLIYII